MEAETKSVGDGSVAQRENQVTVGFFLGPLLSLSPAPRVDFLSLRILVLALALKETNKG